MSKKLTPQEREKRATARKIARMDPEIAAQWSKLFYEYRITKQCLQKWASGRRARLTANELAVGYNRTREEFEAMRAGHPPSKGELQYVADRRLYWRRIAKLTPPAVRRELARIRGRSSNGLKIRRADVP